MFTLETDRGFPLDSEPGEILEDLFGVRTRAAGRIDVLDAKEKPAAGFAGEGEGLQGGKGMPLVKQAGRTRGEAGDEGFAGHGSQRTHACALV